MMARYAKMQASVVDVKVLERQIVEFQKQEKLQERLEGQLKELQDKVRGE